MATRSSRIVPAIDSASPTPRMGRNELILVIGLFVCSTVLYALLGVRFNADATGMQFIEPTLLTDRLAESLWYYHAAPPVLNLIVGIGLKVFGEHAVYFYSVLFHAIGLLVALSVYALTWRLSGSRIAAAITTALLVFSPSFVLYENALFYDFLGMALLVWATFALYEFVRTRGMKWCVGFFALLGTLLLTRSLFHLVWMIAITAVLLALFWSWRRQILIAAAVPFLVVTLWYAKNYYYFGKFGASTWMGFGLSNITQALIPLPELVPLVERGELSEWALVSRYDSRFPMFTADLRPPFGVPVVDAVQKVDGRLNWNYRDIPVVDRYYAADALTEMRRFPALYVYGLYLANCMYFAPTTTGPYWLPSNLEAIRPLERVFTPLLSGVSANATFVSLGQGRFRFPDHIAVPARANFVLLLAWLGVFAWAYTVARRALVERAARAEPRVVVMGFLVVTAAYAYVLSTALELGENYRYRFLLEPLFFVLTAAAVTAAIRAARVRWAGRPVLP